MIDLKYIRENPEELKNNLSRRNMSDLISSVDVFLEKDARRRKLEWAISDINAQRKVAAKSQDFEAWKRLKWEASEIESALQAIQEEAKSLAESFPNIIHEDTPDGKDDTENVVRKKVGTPREFDFPVRDHVELGEMCGIIDIETAWKVSGARFAYILGDLARVQFGIVQMVMSWLTDEEWLKGVISKYGLSASSKPFTPVIPPVIIQQSVAQKMWRLHPKDDRYCLEEDWQVFVWSAEHSLGPIHMNQTINESEMPIRYIGYSTSFRREAGSSWRDTKWIIRQHQFDKMEMETFSTPETSVDEQELLVAIQQELMVALELPYQVVQVCTWDIGKPDSRQVDIETWIPSQECYRETHSADLMTDYQARRMSIKVQRASWKDFVHMNDATAIAMWRTLVALVENHQNEDGSITIPKILQGYLGGKEIIKKRNNV